MSIVLICEKPSAAKTIAEALAEDGVTTKEGVDGVKYYEFVRDGKDHISIAAVGHLFSLKQVGKGWDYPRFDVHWIPSFEATKAAAFSEKYYRTIESIAKEADECIIATDYDDEGGVIGYNILTNMFGRKDAPRMKFSTMTHDELIKSYEKPEKSMDKGQVESGLARHYMDYIWGINLTRALTLAIKKTAQRFVILSTGRVQGPVLHMLAKHEKKIKAFKPKPFWELLLNVKVGNQTLDALYEKDKIWDEKDAKTIFGKLKSKNGVVSNVTSRIMSQKPPIPYNTTSLLADIYRYFGYSPKQGLDIAESLYQSGLISYPRTSSQKLPVEIGYEKIIKNIAKQDVYKQASKLIGTKLEPMQGQRADPAHPSVYPTGENPKKLSARQRNVYDLVVRHFLACFGQAAERESIRVELDVDGQKFVFNGKKTLKSGWTDLYGKYAKREEIILPKLDKGDKIPITKKDMLAKETPPPARYSQGSVLKEMENQGLGTKATRAQILQTLYTRGYLVGQSIEVTELGMAVSDILEKNVPDVISEKLTRHFEEEAEKIQTGETTREKVVKESEKELVKISEEFKKREDKIGKELTTSVIETQEKAAELGPCPKCKTGILSVHKSWRTKKRFVGCSNYKNGCKTGFPLPSMGTIINTGKICDKCKTPIIQVGRMGARPFRMCLDPECVTKKDWLNKKTLKKAKEDSIKSKNEFDKLQARAESLGLKCKECGQVFKTKRGLGIHTKRSHTAKK